MRTRGRGGQKWPILGVSTLWMAPEAKFLQHFYLKGALWFKNSPETFFKAILGTDLGQVCKFWGVNLAPEPLKLTSFHGQIDQ